MPIEVAIDEYGIVRSLRPNLETLEREFLNRTFAPDDTTPPGEPRAAVRPDLAVLRRLAEQGGSYQAWRDLGNALVLWAGPGSVDEAIRAYTRALGAKPDDGDAAFRLGVCYRTRSESERPKPGDFQTAVNHWMTAHSLQPHRYIWRRRIEQYGPRLTKPYPFYDWVPTATSEIRARGDQPVELKVSLTGSELAGPKQGWEASPDTGKPPDPEGQIERDMQDLVLAEVTVIPPKVKPGEAVRIHLALRPNEARKARWSDEGKTPRVWIDLPPSWRAQALLFITAPTDRPDGTQPHYIECDIGTPADANGTARLLAHALYEICHGEDGTSRLLRQDIPIMITVDK